MNLNNNQEQVKNSAFKVLVLLLISLITACNGSSNKLEVSTLDESVEAPSSHSTSHTGRAVLRWASPVKNTDDTSLKNLKGFILYYGESRDSMTNKVIIDDPSATSYEFTNLKKNTHYYFSVVAYNESGIESELSEIVDKLIK
jgi:hypothetical protein